MDLTTSSNKGLSKNLVDDDSKTITPSLYGTKTLLCKNKCGYYGNSIQYDGYCSICYRKLKTYNLNNSYKSSSYVSSFNSFDDSSTLLSSSSSLNLDENKLKNKQSQNQNWNENSNLNKFSSKQEKRKNSTFNKIFRRPSSNFNSNSSSLSSQIHNTSLNIVDTVTKVADKAVNLVDQSLSASIINTLNNSSSHPYLNTSFVSNENSNLIELFTTLNKLMTASNSIKQTDNFLIPFSNRIDKTASNNDYSLLKTFEDQFRLNFPQLYQELIKQMKQFLEKFLDLSFKNGDFNAEFNNTKQSEAVQEFYKKIYKYILNNFSIKPYYEKISLIKSNHMNTNLSNLTNLNHDVSNDLLISDTFQNINNNEDIEKFYEALMIMIESYINNSIYDHVFPSIMSEFEEQDIKLQKRIRSFYWITNEMIGTCIDENSIFYKDSYEEALNSIVEVDSKRTAFEKMNCITECSKNIFKALNISTNIQNSLNVWKTTSNDLNNVLNSNENSNEKQNNSQVAASADDFLPALIYIVLKANPTMLYSNINFITRFAFEKRILQGEHAYHFCSLNAVIAHIENLNANHLNMKQEEFDSYSNGLVDMDSSANVLKLIQSNLKILSELNDKQKLLKQEALILQKDIHLFRKLMDDKFSFLINDNKEAICIKNEKSIYKNNILDDNLDLIEFNKTSKDLIESLKLDTVFSIETKKN